MGAPVALCRVLVLFGCLAISGLAAADDLTWDARGQPLEVCGAVQKNMRFLYNAWTNGARETYGELKAYLQATLSGKGEPEARLLAVYDGLLPRLEQSEFAPPNVPDRVAGHNKLRQVAGTACLSAFPKQAAPRQQ
jgi:hypothetical protein